MTILNVLRPTNTNSFARAYIHAKHHTLHFGTPKLELAAALSLRWLDLDILLGHEQEFGQLLPALRSHQLYKEKCQRLVGAKCKAHTA